MNQSSELISQKVKWVSELNSNDSFFCNSCLKVFVKKANYDKHMLRFHAFCIWCKNYPIGENQGQWYKSASEFQRKSLYNHLIQCASSSESVLYVCDICFGFSNDSRIIHFREKCNGFSKAAIMDKSSMQYATYEENNLFKKDSLRVQSDHKSSQDKSKKLDFFKLVMTSQDRISFEEFLDSIHNHTVEQQCHYLGDTDWTYNAILNTSVCASFSSGICAQSCDVTSS